MARKLRSAEHLLAPAVAKTIDNLTTTDEDAGAVRLAEQYAAIIDRAESAAVDAEEAFARLDPEEIDAYSYVTRLEAKVKAQDVLEKLGPKLLAALGSLGATPAARSKLRGGGGASGGPTRLQAAREARARA